MKRLTFLVAVLASLSGVGAAVRPSNLPPQCYVVDAPLGHLLACRHYAVGRLALSGAQIRTDNSTPPTTKYAEFWAAQNRQEALTYITVINTKRADVRVNSPLLRNALDKLQTRIDLHLAALPCTAKRDAVRDALEVDAGLTPHAITTPLLLMPCKR